MKNILNIGRHDLKKVTGSVVAMITMMGLCIVPCLYAWFNIFSNWSPYEADATGRIPVAVANADEGYTAAGLSVNVGDKIVSALQANDAIGWTFVDSEEEAKQGVLASEYYAAIVVPEDFSAGVLSFVNGSLTNPEIKYYENEKKNAIAPKITGKAKTALQEEVNAAFVETLASYASDAASVAEASGTDPSGLLAQLSDRVDGLAGDVNSFIALADSAAGLTQAAGALMDAGDSLIDSSQDVLNENDRVLVGVERKLPEKEAKIEKKRREAAKLIDDVSDKINELQLLVTDIMTSDIGSAPLVFNSFVLLNRDGWVVITDELQKKAEDQADIMSSSGYDTLAADFSELAVALGTVSSDLQSLSVGMNESERTAALEKLAADITSADNIAEGIKTQIRTDIESDLDRALANTKQSFAAYRNSLRAANDGLGDMSSLMGEYGASLKTLQSSAEQTTENLRSLQRGAGTVSGLLSNAAGNELLKKLKEVTGNDEAALAEYLANPVKMDTQVLWSIENYGSAMAPFYTVLAQWVGALLTAVLIKVRVKKRDDLRNLKLHEWFFGRYGLYLLVGVSQALIVSLGDLLYIGIQCRNPLAFVLAACVNGMVFTMINYALVFALDNIGLGAGVIILVLQVAGSGGTYPVEVLPQPFQVIYPFMPFRYSMDAMRECIAGMYGNAYAHCIGILAGFFIFAAAFGLALYRPARRLNEMIAASKAKSEIML